MSVTPVPFEIDLSVHPEVHAFFDPQTNTISYVVRDPGSKSCAVIDSVMDFDLASGRISFEHADAIVAFVRQHGWKVEWLIETHAHADHLSAAPYIQQHLGGKLGIGANIRIAIALEGPLAIPGIKPDTHGGLTGFNNQAQRSVIRDMRSGNRNDSSSDISRGFVRDPVPPRVIGEIVMYLERVDDLNAATQVLRVYKGGVQHEIDRGDVMRLIVDNSGSIRSSRSGGT